MVFIYTIIEILTKSIKNALLKDISDDSGEF